MKYINLLLILLVLVSCGSGPEIPCIPAKLSDHVIAFYPFSDQSLADISGNSVNLVNNDNCISVKDRNGNDGCAYRFNGTKSQYLTRDGSFLNGFKSKSFSISFWYQPLDGENARQFLFVRGEPGKTNCDLISFEEWYIGLHDCERICFFINKKAQLDDFPSLWQDPDLKDKCATEINLYNNKWHHIVVTYNRGILELFRNGIKALKDTQTWNCGALVEGQGDFFVGKNLFGDIDDIVIFDKALNISEIDELYRIEPCCN